MKESSQTLGRKALTFQKGFTLLELVLVIAIIAALAVAVLPSLRVHFDSPLSSSLRAFSAQIQGAHDRAFVTHRLHRLVLNLKTGHYFVEALPASFHGRPPAISPLFVHGESESAALDRLFKKIQEEEKQDALQRSLGSDGQANYKTRRMLVAQKSALLPVVWEKVITPLIVPQALLSPVVFESFYSSLDAVMKDRQGISNKLPQDDSVLGVIYFLPDGTSSPASIVLTDGEKAFSGQLMTLTGQLQIKEGR